ncbi:hypothetical protein [Arthrobacter sp. H14-L1]|nr:hypothetical protein [Arthrobacter sp. H14-L1]
MTGGTVARDMPTAAATSAAVDGCADQVSASSTARSVTELDWPPPSPG